MTIIDPTQTSELNRTHNESIDHLVGTRLPELTLLATDNDRVNLAELSGTVIVYVYPMTGRPDTPPPDGWDQIPGAKGCTPQSCSFRDHFSELLKCDARVFGLSTQSTEYQLEAKERLDLPFELLSDLNLNLKDALNLPTFDDAGIELYKRITLIVRDGAIDKVFYPVFSPGENANEVLKWLQSPA